MPVSSRSAITPEIEALAGGNGTALGTGGMVTKLRAARIAAGKGIDMVIANGARPELIYDILEGKRVGTRFIGVAHDLPSLLYAPSGWTYRMVSNCVCACAHTHAHTFNIINSTNVNMFPLFLNNTIPLVLLVKNYQQLIKNFL